MILSRASIYIIDLSGSHLVSRLRQTSITFASGPYIPSARTRTSKRVIVANTQVLWLVWHPPFGDDHNLSLFFWFLFPLTAVLLGVDGT